MEDLYSYSLLGLTMSANAYDPTKGVPFANFASQKAMFWAIDEMRKDGILKRRGAKAGPSFVSINEPVSGNDQITFEVPDGRAGDAQDKLEARDLCSTLLNQLRSQDRQLLIMYYGQHLTFKEIAHVFDISESSVCLRHKALIKKLRKMASTMNAA
jgi:RNA polymerase sigma factor (sigma-70 family)